MLPSALERAFSASESAEKVKQAFAELRSFNLSNFPAVIGSSGISNNLRQISLAIKKVISVAKNLERLDLGDIDDILSVAESHRISLTDLTEIRGDLGYVQYLKLHAICGTAHGWKSFLRNHALTLIEVGFHYVYCTDQGWEIIVKELRKASWPNLEEFYLDICHDPRTLAEEDQDVSDIMVTDYLCRRTNRNPREKLYVYYSM